MFRTSLHQRSLARCGLVVLGLAIAGCFAGCGHPALSAEGAESTVKNSNVPRAREADDVARFLAGLPGIALSLVLLAVVREVPRPIVSHRPIHLREGVVHLARYKTLRHLALAIAFAMISTHAAWSWMASYMIRHLGMPIAQVGTELGLLFGFGGAFGNFSIGLLSDRLGIKNIGWYLWLPAIISALLRTPDRVYSVVGVRAPTARSRGPPHPSV